MYIQRIVDRNVGPLKDIDISLPFQEDGQPKPVIFVGENGSGKSTLLSNIVDSFYEFAGEAYTNAVKQNEAGLGHTFYKIVSNMQITLGEEYQYSWIKYDDADYILRSGDISFEQFKKETCYEGIDRKWDKGSDPKEVFGLKDDEIKKVFHNNVICYFSPSRFEKPVWLGKPYYDDPSTHLSIKTRFDNSLYNPIEDNEAGKNNLRWLLDVIADARADVYPDGNGKLDARSETGDAISLMYAARKNVEDIMSTIMNEDVYFGLNLRSHNGSRFNIKKRSNREVLVPALDSLSTGQLALFDIFTTIIRYADQNDINQSFRLESITGIVVIDEIELHLHTSLQYKVLPSLMKLFPKVQFIITTHSPLFILGMRDQYSEDDFEIYQLPDGKRIDTERFSEFQRAYEYFSSTQTHQDDIRKAIEDDDTSTNILIVTEGATDWKHMKAAYNNLKDRTEYKDIFDGLAFDFLEYEPTNSAKDTSLKIEMGNTDLEAMCRQFSKIPQKRKIVFIADRDNEKTNKALGTSGAEDFKNWGNNVYSFILPLPDSRKETPAICIEHYYSDEEIMTPYKIGDKECRLYMGKEFDSRGLSLDHKKLCKNLKECGKDKINIIEGSSKERVTALDDENQNLALPKMQFAENILHKTPGFDHFDFSNFILIFKVIKEISEQ